MANGEFLGKDDFLGCVKPPPKNQAWIAESTFRGALVFFNRPSAEVEKLLPKQRRPDEPTFVLAEKKDAAKAPGLHPVMLVLGHHEDPSQRLIDTPHSEQFADYDELGLMIPFVQRGSEESWYSFIVRMHLDSPNAVYYGNYLYGYAKKIAHMKREEQQGVLSRFKTATEREVQQGVASFKTAKDFVEHFDAALSMVSRFANEIVEEQPPNYGAMLEIVSMTVLGFRVRDDKYVCSYWQWDCTAAKVHAIASCHKFLAPFVAGAEDWVGKEMESVDDGAVAVSGIKWRLGKPLACGW